jgi:hypothetical protein
MHALGDAIVIAYLVGATVNGCVAFCGCLMVGRSGLRKSTVLGVLAGAAWPVVMIGVIQILLVAAVFDGVRYFERAAKNRTERTHATRVETAGWGMTSDLILVASVHRPQPARRLRSTSSHSTASIAHCCACCPQS